MINERVIGMKSNRFRYIMRTLITLLGAGIGAAIALLVFQIIAFYNFEASFPPQTMALVYLASAITGALLLYFIAPFIINGVQKAIVIIEKRLEKMPMQQVMGGTAGLIVGLVVAFLVTQIFTFLGTSIATTAVSAIVYVVIGSMGINVGMKRGRELNFPFAELQNKEKKQSKTTNSHSSPCKILDTSVIIDGRVFDICKTGFIEGELVIPQFVLAELRHISDSADALRRNRGRRGLDVLNRIQNEIKLPIKIEETDYDDIQEVDVKLLRLAKQLGGIVVTNDYNLNKVAGVTGLKVLNINELANAVKSVVLAGEEMVVQIVKEGKEPGQGIGYLDDGTMIVAENAKRYLGEMVEVVVTTVLQTSAGRMIFARLKATDVA